MVLLPSAILIQETDDQQFTTAIKDENSAADIKQIEAQNSTAVLLSSAPNIKESGLK